jgi:uncharacterized protein YlxW (UPF0749 family)
VPTDTSAFPGDIYAGPYGFLVAIAFFVYLAARELRRYRQIDVDTYKSDLSALRAELEDRDKRHQAEAAELSDAVEDLKADLKQLREENLANLRRASLDQERLIRENGALRALLAAHNVSTEGISG